MSLTRFEDEVDEETPFLPNQEVLPDSNPTRTPLPIAQISILLTAWLAESITSHSISPYLNQVQYLLALPIGAEHCFQLVRELPAVGGDARKVGYYTGIIVRLAFSKRADNKLHDRCLFITRLTLPLHSSGIAYQTTLDASLSLSPASWAQQFRFSYLDCRIPYWRLF
jgi:hypothetical protein